MIRLEQARLDANLTVRQLAAMAGVSRQTIYTAERTGRASDETRFALAAALGIAPSSLLLPAVQSTTNEPQEAPV